MLKEPAADGVTGFVVGYCALLRWVEDAGAIGEAGDDTFNSRLEMSDGDFGSVGAGSYRHRRTSTKR